MVLHTPREFYHVYGGPIVVLLLGALLTSAPALASPAPGKDVVCKVSQLSARFDNKQGEFDGMSQRGTFLVLRNAGEHSCQISMLPVLVFEGKDRYGHPLTVQRRMPRGMHPGPALMSVDVAPGASVAIKLHWVAGDVYDGHNCVTTKMAVLSLPGNGLKVPLEEPMCAQKGSTQFFDQSPLGPLL